MITVPATTAVNRAFPISECLGELPEDIPGEFEHQVKWGLFFHILFFTPDQLVRERVGMLPQEGVEAADAWRALEVLLGVRDMSHERKEALWPFLASQWFSDVRWETTKGETITFDDVDFDAEWVKLQEADGG